MHAYLSQARASRDVINIVSVAPRMSGWGGATKVYWNLVKGLDALGYPWVADRDLQSTERLWIHSNVFALPEMRRTRSRTVLGPNLFVMPSEIPKVVQFDGAVYVQPSEWVAQLWRAAGFDACPVEVWPVGVDTGRFAARSPEGGERDVLVYYKRRPLEELAHVERHLRVMGLRYRVLRFGSYAEDEYRRLLASTSFVVWVGCPESQGLALEEALATDVPVLLWDATRLEQANIDGVYTFDSRFNDFPVTSAPYFDTRCGRRITLLAELGGALEDMRRTWPSYRPRLFVMEHLSLDGQARALIDLWQRWGLTFEDGLRETARTDAALFRPHPIDTLIFRWQRRFGPRLRLTPRW